MARCVAYMLNSLSHLTCILHHLAFHNFMNTSDIQHVSRTLLMMSSKYFLINVSILIFLFMATLHTGHHCEHSSSVPFALSLCRWRIGISSYLRLRLSPSSRLHLCPSLGICLHLCYAEPSLLQCLLPLRVLLGRALLLLLELIDEFITGVAVRVEYRGREGARSLRGG